MKKSTLILLLCLINIGKVTACECRGYLIDLPIQEMGLTLTETKGLSNFSDLIFNGTLINGREVTERQKDALGNEYESSKIELIFKVLKTYKGETTDTIRIRTNRGGDACGFGAKQNTDCLIFAQKGENGIYYTYRSDCCKSISKEYDIKRYEKYLKFFHVIFDKIDGDYTFYQTKFCRYGRIADDKDTLKAMQFSIKNGRFEGDWVIMDRNERVLEKGKFKNGKRDSTWTILSFRDSKYPEAEDEIKTEVINYKKGLIKEKIAVIEDKGFNYENIESGKNENIYVTLRRQTLKNNRPPIIEYFDMNGKKITK